MNPTVTPGQGLFSLVALSPVAACCAVWVAVLRGYIPAGDALGMSRNVPNWFAQRTGRVDFASATIRAHVGLARERKRRHSCAGALGRYTERLARDRDITRADTVLERRWG